MTLSRRDSRVDPNDARSRALDLLNNLKQFPTDCYPPISDEMDSMFDELILLDTPVAGWLMRFGRSGINEISSDEIASIRRCEADLCALVSQVEACSPVAVEEVECKEVFSAWVRCMLEGLRLILANA